MNIHRHSRWIQSYRSKCSCRECLCSYDCSGPHARHTRRYLQSEISNIKNDWRNCFTLNTPMQVMPSGANV